MVRKLTKLQIDEVSLVDRGAGEGVKILLHKNYVPQDNTMQKFERNGGEEVWRTHDGATLFNDIMKAKAIPPRTEQPGDSDNPRIVDDSGKVSTATKQLVQQMVNATGGKLHPNRALRWLMHTEKGRDLLAIHLNAARPQPNNISKAKDIPMDIMKVIEITEQGLMAQVTKQDGKSYAQSFAKKFENDIEFRKQWRDLTEAKQFHGYTKKLPNLMDITPVSVGVGNTNSEDDSAKAVKQLQDLAEKQHRTFAEVFLDDSNRELANRTYTQHHRSSINQDYSEGERG